MDEDIIKHIKENPTQLRNEIVTARFWNLKKQPIVKFSAIIGNPPYQDVDGGGRGDAASPIYDQFIGLAKKIHFHYITFIFPARWYAGGRGLDDFRSSMLQDKNIMELHDIPETDDCFHNVNIRGGICYCLWHKNNTLQPKITNHIKGKYVSMRRPLLEYESEVFIRFNQSVGILRKVQKCNEKTLEKCVSVSRPFGLRSNFNDYKKYPSDKYNILLYKYPGVGYVEEKVIPRGNEMLNKYKVLISKASPGGDEIPHKIISNPIVAEPGSICTETYLVIQSFSKLNTAQNVATYARTRFFRFMMMLAKSGQNISKATYHFVPLQDFTSHSDIDWNKSIGEIDAQLYSKYGLTKTEIDFIEKLIKPM